MISGPQPRCWLDLAPLSTRTALRTNPLGDLGGSTELAEPPLVGNARIPRRTRSRHLCVARTRWARKAVGSAPACPLPCRTLTLLVPSPRARLPGLGEETWSRTATWSQGQHRLLLGDQVVDTHRQGERNRARTAKAGARVHPVVPAPPSAGRSALESHQQGHTEQLAGASFHHR